MRPHISYHIISLQLVHDFYHNIAPSRNSLVRPTTMRLFSQNLLHGLILSLVIDLSLPPACLANSAPDVLSLTFTWVHDCAAECLDNHGHGIQTLANVLNCDSPVYNFCYCPTDTKSINSIRSWLSQCVSTRCDSPDFSVDVSAVESGYASYCIDAGYSQSGATTWFQPTPTQAAVSTSATQASPGASPGTTTLVTVVSQTATLTGTANSGGSSPVAPFGKSGWLGFTLLPLVTTVFAWAVPLLIDVVCSNLF